MNQPNVFLVVLDSVRVDHLSTYGYGRETTPNLTALSETATKYTQAISAGPWTPVSHGAMFTGQWPSTNGVYGRQPMLDPERPHIAELLSDAGYDTMGFSNSYHTSPDRGFDRGFDYYHDILSLPRLAGTMYEPSLDFLQHVYDYIAKGYDDSSFQLRKLKTKLRTADQPVFAFINMNSAHSPYNPPDEIKRQFESYIDSNTSADREVAKEYSEDAYKYLLGELEMGDAEWELVKSWYDGEIRYMDELLGDFFDFLKRKGMFDDSMLIITSDHGELFGEDGLVYHQFSLSETLLNVPLLIKYPGQTTGDISESLLSLIDIAPTISALATETIPDEMDGQNLNADPDRQAVYAEYAGPSESMTERLATANNDSTPYAGGLQAIRTSDYKLVLSSDGDRKLYKIEDGVEVEYKDEEVVERLCHKLTSELDPLPSDATEEELDSHIEDHLRDMGYM